MEAKHIKFDYEEALEGKKEVLSSQLNLIKIEKQIRNFRILRKKEIAVKNMFRIALRNTITKINLLESTFPKEEETQSIKQLKKGIEKRKMGDIQYQLKEIEDKLAKLQ